MAMAMFAVAIHLETSGLIRPFFPQLGMFFFLWGGIFGAKVAGGASEL